MGSQVYQGNQSYPTCPKCKKRHEGECQVGTNTCYQCCRPDHIARDCRASLSNAPAPNQFRENNQVPRGNYQRNTAQARVYSLTPGDAENADDIVTGAKHSFISLEYIKLCGVETQLLHAELFVVTLTVTIVLCRKVLRDYSVDIQGRMLLVDLVVFDMLGFDVILRMDWLAFNYVSIDCYKKEVVFRPPGEQEYKFVGSCVCSSPQIMSAIQEKRLLESV
ncbi:uncharacterized protein LOC131144249 [Malania oleifera]|uniref:uncharacterized protein LOC131144249 n=1 Tax=Malania oleifera TaxID=397392 RepID=UPI0025AE0436|nr:uncharacterized protein LOC131144249 [Malania oleifera]